jgi:N-acetylglutamate synthase-like GNAT family acetyltransferase
MLDVIITPFPPAGFKDLAWDVFFHSRARGLSLVAHFPWLDSGRGFFVTASEHGVVVAGLAVKIVKSADGTCSAGVLGLVCVHPSHRGKNYSAAILQHAISEARLRELDDLILWTGKPAVYEKLGFRLFDTSSFGTVVTTRHAREVQPQPLRADFPSRGDERGLPPFAQRGYRIESSGATVVIVEDGSGPILAEWSGVDHTVVQLLGQTMPARWRINTLAGDKLPKVLAEDGWEINLHASNLQMILPLRLRPVPADPYHLRVLDRI